MDRSKSRQIKLMIFFSQLFVVVVIENLIHSLAISKQRFLINRLSYQTSHLILVRVDVIHPAFHRTEPRLRN